VYHEVCVGKEAVEWRWWYQAARFVGSLWFWMAVGVVVGLARPGAWRRRVRAGLGVLAAALLAGAAAELLKPVIGRERPLLHDGQFVFLPLTGWLSDAGRSFPSSHAAVAFGGAWMLWRLARGGGSVWRIGAWLALGVATCCGVSRMLTGAHFLSDVIAGGMIGALAAIGLARLVGPRLARHRPGVCLLRRRWVGRGGAGRAGTLGA
jgi:undecaprenyl-diphosphatase